MSVKVMSLVWDHYPEGGGELLTALKLADHADHGGSRIFPGIASVAILTRQSERTVQRHVQRMIENGWLEVVKEGGHGPASTSHYRIPIERIHVGATRVTNLHPTPKPLTGLATELSTAPVRVTPEALRVTTGAFKGDTAMSPESSLKATVSKATVAEGAKPAPSAVAQCWQVYSEAIKARHGVSPPPNAKANGQLAALVARIGAEGAPRLTAFYVAHGEPFYAKTSHSLDFLVRDSQRLWIEMERAGGRREAPIPTKAELAFEYDTGATKHLQDYPIGEPLDLARKCVSDYGGMVARARPKNVIVKIGAQAHRYSIAELDPGRRA